MNDGRRARDYGDGAMEMEVDQTYNDDTLIGELL